MTYNRSGEKDSTARLAGLVPVLQAWHKKKVFYFIDVWEILPYVFCQGDLETFYQLFFWSDLYATLGTPAYMETCFQYKQASVEKSYPFYLDVR